MDDDAPLASEITTRHQKRARVDARVAGDEPSRGKGDNGENQDGSSDGSDGSPDLGEREVSQDDFEEIRPKTKRVRAAEGTSDVPNRSVERLIEVIKGDGKHIYQAVKRWVERYERNPKPALVELLMLLFEACGAKYYIKEEFLDETDVDDVVVALVNIARNGEVEDYQGSKKKEFKNFKENLVSFWDNLVIECQNGPLFDKDLFDKCMDYIIALSCTPPRVYRQAASMMGLQLVTSFISVAKRLAVQRDTTQRQLNAERKKRADGPRVESLNNRLSATHEQKLVIDEMMRKIFTGLFVHRYRDVDPNIRMSCIQSLGVWILSYPTLFLQDLYLKYLGWTLNDKSAGVRKAAVLSLQNLYEVEDNVPTLSLFTERFSNRMIELADDVDVSVAVCAIGLVKQLLRHQLIPDDDLGSLYDLLIDDPPEIRRAIGELVYDHLIAQKFNSSQSSSKGNESEVHLGRMLQILREFSTDPILSIYVIDDVWEYMKAMKDWKCIISMLLDENPLIELTDEDATNLTRLLFASVRKAVGERIVPASDNRKQYFNKAQKEMFENNRQDLTVAMMKNYPLLLRKFMADKAKISSLVEIILYMNLELYSLKRQEQNFRNTLLLIKDAFFKHGEKDALRSCVKAITFCSTESRGELQDFARNKLKELEDELLDKLKSATKEVIDGEDEYSLLVNLKRLYELQLLRPVSIEEIYGDCITILHSFRNLDDEVVSFLLLNMSMDVAWSFHSIINSETVSEGTLSSLLSKRDTLLEELEYFLNTPPEVREGSNSGNQLACWVCIILADIWFLFRKTVFLSTKLERLGYCPDAPILQKFWTLCEKRLRILDETDDEDVNREYTEETNKDNVMLVAAKLIASDTVPKDNLAPEIISHFVMHGAGIAEIVKNLITVLRKKDDNVSVIFLEALKRAYHRYLELSESDDESLKSESFQECKNLASRLAGMLVGAARNKHRPEVLKIVKEGIEYAFQDAPQQLSFLEASVLHFASRLPPPDIRDILKDAQKRTENVNTEEDPSGWRPYNTFYDTLQEKCAKNDGIQDEKELTTARRRGRPRKRQNIEGRRLFDEHNSSEEEDSINISDQEDAQVEEDEEEDNAPLIHSLKSSAKLRSLRVSRQENRGK
ncbi:sister-chromatid cohesion protein 3, SISTER-CHROMATID COHESION PROTEIN 3 [Hibiscus trionum]|uniref:Sister-chromatid cohesion protein 3, SISTER-CHROMATID COHESION PROTEIN 3 n=1 Tax=Hibiscus trionum TaxID=183268 RepID=A0A9W7LJF5_HIBTR|nr:sister-chromatid cohesion protein 3, SISTER-CHROMATID COHESION PROTEIN 3 [Hibiscus trionum]